MNVFRNILKGVAPIAATAVIAGCGGSPAQSGAPAVPPAVASELAKTMVHYLQIPMHARPAASWMRPLKKKSTLIYTADNGADDVAVFDYPSGKLVGVLTNISAPYGGCVNAKGDVFMSIFTSGETVEIAHGGTQVINTYTSSGEPIGCSVNKNGDLAVSSFSPGEVTVYAGGDPSKGTTYTDSSCEYQWAMGYDDKGNLMGVGEYSDIAVCALMDGSKSETTLSTSGISIDFPGGSIWDGKYIALGDQEADGQYVTGLHEASLSGSQLTQKGEAVLGASCGEFDDVNPFVLGTKNTPVNNHRGKVVVGANFSCGSTYTVGYWHYPAGGNPYGGFTTSDAGPVIAVSIGK